LTRPEFDADGPILTVLMGDARVRRLAHDDIPLSTHAVAKVRIGKQFNSRRPRDRVDLASSMRSALGAAAHSPPSRPLPPAEPDARLQDLRARLRAHPCHGCADREDHVRWANRWANADKE